MVRHAAAVRRPAHAARTDRGAAGGLLTALVVAAEIRVSEGTLNPNMVVAPPAIAAVATAVFVHLQRQAARQRVLIDDLVRTRRDLAATERRAGILAERQRLSTEIHDTLAQGLSSQQMLLQAAERVWSTDPDTARGHIRDAAEITSRSLAEARRFVHDLAPADLAERTLAEALSALADRESGPGLTVDFRLDGTPGPLPERVEAALLRIAQGALANVREHAAATRAALTLTCLDDQVSLDIADNGRGFDPTDGPAGPRSGPGARARAAGHADPGTAVGRHAHRGVHAGRGHRRVGGPPPRHALDPPDTPMRERLVSPHRSPSSPIRLLLCDDHAVVRAGLRALLSSTDGIEVVGEAGSGEEALAVAARSDPTWC